MNDNEKIKDSGMKETEQQHAQAAALDNEFEKKAEQLQEQLDACKATQQEWREKYMHVAADLENFKRRMAKEQAVWAQAAQGKVLVDLLAIVDDFDRAIQEQEKEKLSDEVQAWLAGFDMIHNGLHSFLKKQGIEEIPVDKPFDPEYHEALLQVESDEHESGTIVAVMQKGYLFKGTVLRPAKVSVAK